MSISLASLAQEYLDDTTYLDEWRKTTTNRKASLASLTPIVEQFADGAIDINNLRIQVDQALRSTDNWGATGHWLQTLNKINRNHGTAGEAGLRQTLKGANADNVGTRIEQFTTFLLQERERFRREQKNLLGAAFPGSADWLISLFVYWLDPQGQPYILYPSFRRGLKALLDASLLNRPDGLRVDNDAIVIRTENDYRAVAQALDSLVLAEPELKASGIEPFWAEAFLNWLTENPDVLIAPADTSVTSPPSATIIPHEPLVATSEVLLRRLIADVRSHILIEEDLVRRIYHALLAGHVILSGPPGTGKTELARLIPELLWQSEVNAGSSPNPLAPSMATQRTTQTAYATRLVTATDEWSVRTLIGGIAPSSTSGQVNYRIQHGHLTKVILENWAVNEANPAGWDNPQRKSIQAPSYVYDGEVREFRGRWLVIDEFNRAPIDLALGEALTALGGSGLLRVPVDGGSTELPLPKDFRIVGTLNSFDRNYLNQISEALKRRFSFIEVLPPTRARRAEERAMVLAKALAGVAHLHLTNAIVVNPDHSVNWPGVVTLSPAATGGFTAAWATPAPALHEAFDFVWNVFEIIRIYRQLGTAQAISLLRQMLIAGIVQNYTTVQQWIAAADLAFCDTIADQLQVLLPDELEVLINALTLDRPTFTLRLNTILQRLLSSPRRLAAQIGALNAVVDNQGNQIVTLPEEVDQLTDQNLPQIGEAEVIKLFNWQNDGHDLPLFTRRLRIFKTERGL